jgi:hypothetical protein
MPPIIRQNFPGNLARLEVSRRARVTGIRGQGISIQWFDKQVVNKVSLTMQRRMAIVVRLLRNKTILNISRPVTKEVVDQKVVVSNRSKPGEYPKADTTALMSTLITGTRMVRKNVWEGFVGTPLDYGLFLETSMNRRFLSRTLFASLREITTVLTAPMKVSEVGVRFTR